jgi:SAM-dependent methyltransferase
MGVSSMQISLFDYVDQRQKGATDLETLERLLSDDLDFHEASSSYASHTIHAFPAKFPPQLPRKFIVALTKPGDMVLDPMVGSGTTILEAWLTGRRGLGCDIDPLAVLLSRVKTRPVDPETALQTGLRIAHDARWMMDRDSVSLEKELAGQWDEDTHDFVDYWFTRSTQRELYALSSQIARVADLGLRAFLQLVFSAIIITKSGGVSLAFDLAHTRPHRAKVAYAPDGEVVLGEELVESDSRRVQFLTKTLRSPVAEFEKRLRSNVQDLVPALPHGYAPLVQYADSQHLPLRDASVDLVVTSPPYASNAIDYMRAHKFSLVWFGHPIGALGDRRRQYIGADATTQVAYEELPEHAGAIVEQVAHEDAKKALVLHRYYSEMMRAIREMHRVLKPGKAAILVVGNSTMRGIDTETDLCLAEIGQAVGFSEAIIGVRNLDRNRRMMPSGHVIDGDSQIQQRMHQEYVIGLLKASSS